MNQMACEPADSDAKEEIDNQVDQGELHSRDQIDLEEAGFHQRDHDRNQGTSISELQCHDGLAPGKSKRG